MAGGFEAGYLLLIEWDDRFVRPGVVARHRLACPEDMPEADFEKLMVDTVLPRLASVSTRTGGVTRASLIKADSTVAGSFLDLRTELPPGARDEAIGFRLVSSLLAKSSS